MTQCTACVARSMWSLKWIYLKMSVASDSHRLGCSSSTVSIHLASTALGWYNVYQKWYTRDKNYENYKIVMSLLIVHIQLLERISAFYFISFGDLHLFVTFSKHSVNSCSPWKIAYTGSHAYKNKECGSCAYLLTSLSGGKETEYYRPDIFLILIGILIFQ